MADLSLFQPLVWQGLVEKFTAPESLTMYNRIPKTPHPFPTAQWDVLYGSRAVGRFNVPNSEAHIVPRLARSSESAAFAYFREKKVFEPTTLRWLREPGKLATVNAERAVMREVADLNTRLDNLIEFTIWQMFTGVLDIAEDGDSPAVYVDYKIPASHKPTAGTAWASATPTQIIADVRAWKYLVSRDGRTPATEAYASDETISDIFDAFASNGSAPAILLSDRMKDQYYTSGILPGFMGLNWQTQDSVFDANGAGYTANPTIPAQETRFLAQNRVLLGNFTENRPFELIEGPSADLEAPAGHTGKFSKTFFEPDPSARQFLLEDHFLPVITRPEQFVYATVGA